MERKFSDGCEAGAGSSSRRKLSAGVSYKGVWGKRSAGEASYVIVYG